MLSTIQVKAQNPVQYMDKINAEFKKFLKKLGIIQELWLIVKKHVRLMDKDAK